MSKKLKKETQNLKFLNSILTIFVINRWKSHSLPQIWKLSNLPLSIFKMYDLVKKKKKSYYEKKHRSDAQEPKTHTVHL